MPEETEVDFEVIREPWNKYELADGSYIKARFLLIKIKKRGNAYGLEGENKAVAYHVPEGLKGTPSAENYPPEVLKSSIEIDELSYKTISEEWNEYFLEDGTKIRVKSTISKVSRTNKRDKYGDPIYYVEHSQLFKTAPLKKQAGM